MNGEVVHGFEHESIEAKAAWFASLSVIERIQQLDSMYRLAVSLNPKLREGSDVGPTSISVRVLELPSR
jgi:hypothetical protein